MTCSRPSGSQSMSGARIIGPETVGCHGVSPSRTSNCHAGVSVSTVAMPQGVRRIPAGMPPQTTRPFE